MITLRQLLQAAAVLATAQALSAAVPGTINYQGRLTDAAGVPQAGAKGMSLKIHDAATAGILMYSESLGTVTADANGVYAFQFGAAGTTNATTTETLATTDGSTTSYQKALSHTPVLPGSVSVTDGTYNWNETTGNPGTPAAATPTVISGFVIGAIVTDGGSGYATAPAVTITGNGTGAAATATVSGGAVTGITIVNAGSGYTTGATLTITPPQVPFIVNYTNGTITVSYNPAPPAGRTLTATYRYSTTGIAGALAAGPEQWLELTVDGIVQTPRQKILAVPFAMNAGFAENSRGILAKQLEGLSHDIALLAGGIPNNSIVSEKFAVSKINIIQPETTLKDTGATYAPIGSYVNDSSGNYYGSIDKNYPNIIMKGYSVKYSNTQNPVYSGSVYYSDGTSIPISASSNGSFVANPKPSTPVTRISITIGANYGGTATLSVSSNVPGTLAIGLPQTIMTKSQIGLFLNLTLLNQGDQVSAQLIGISGAQPLLVNGYSNVQAAVGTPMKILVSFTPSISNLEAYSFISGYVIRFSE